MKWVKSFENVDVKGWQISMVRVDFTGGGDGVQALYINDELYFYGDEYHDSIMVKINSFVEGAKWSGKNIKFSKLVVKDDDLIVRVSDDAEVPPKNLNSFFSTAELEHIDELFGIGNVVRRHRYPGEMDASEVYYNLSKTPNKFYDFEFNERKEDKNVIKSYTFKTQSHQSFIEEDIIKVEMVCYIPRIIAPGTIDFSFYINDIKLDCSRRTNSGIYTMAKNLFRKSHRS